MQSSPVRAWLGGNLLLVLCYAAISYLLSLLLRQSHITFPFHLGAGLALAAIVCWGPRLLPGVFLGHVAFVFLVSQQNGQPWVLGAVCLAAANTAQAWFGEWLLRRVLGGSPELTRPREVLYFVFLIGVVISAFGASLSLVGYLLAYDFIPASARFGTWLDLWFTKGGGMLVGMPIALALFARPRQIWRPRLASVVLPLTLALALVLYSMTLVQRWDAQAQSATFLREARVAANAVENALREPVAVLAATRGVLAVQADLSTSAFEAAAANYLAADGAIDFVGYAQLVPRQGEQFDRFVATAQADGHPDFKVYEADLPSDKLPPPDEAPLVVRHVEPRARTPDQSFGLNLRSTRSSRVALQQAERSGAPVAAEGFASRLRGGSTGVRVVLFQAVYTGNKPETASARAAALRGAVLVAIDPQVLIANAVKNVVPPLQSCLTDDDPKAFVRHLAGKPDCERPSLIKPELVHPLSFGGRSWTLRLSPAAVGVLHAGSTAQAFTVASMISLALLLILLLMSSGRTQRIQTLAEQRGTALQQTSEALRRNEARFRSIFEHAPVGVFVSTLDGTPQEANPRLLEMLDCNAAELPERYRPYAQEDAAAAQSLIDSGDASRQLQRVLRKPDGTEVQALLLMSLLRDAQGRPESLLCVVQDVTAHLQFEANARAREAAELANRTKSEFLSHMSHELRTPLNGLLGFAQLLQLGGDRSLSERQKDWIAKIGQAGWHLLAMINDVLDLSRIETGNLKVTLERQDVHLLVEEVKALLAPAAHLRGITIRVQLTALARYAIGDATRMREIISNLLSNAIKYNVEGGQILINAQLVGTSHVDIAVTDTGQGLSSAQMASLFQPFNRLGQERSSIEGTGIGLVISRRLAELMNGYLRVGSELGKGTTFTLRLPAADGQSGASMPVNPAFAGVEWRQRRRLVYIEDNAVNIEVMRAVIAQRRLADLSVFEDGAGGLAEVLANPPDLLLLDMQLPDTDGLSVLRKLRAAPQCAAVIVIMVSADALDDQIRQCLEAGAQHYVTKPFNIRELLALLDDLLGDALPG